MTGHELRAIRESLGLSILQFGRALGYQGSDANVSRDIRRYETTPGALTGSAPVRARELTYRQADLLEALAKPRPRMGGTGG